MCNRIHFDTQEVTYLLNRGLDLEITHCKIQKGKLHVKDLQGVTILS